MTKRDERKIRLKSICGSEPWKFLKEYLEEDLAELRAQNDTVEDEKAHHRNQGRIAQIKELLALPEDIEKIEEADRSRRGEG